MEVQELYIYPNNLKQKAGMWLWNLSDLAVIVISAIIDSLYLFGNRETSHENAITVAREIGDAVTSELGLNISVGISWNKIFAKFASDLEKPRGVSLITKENYKEVVWTKPVGSLLLVGKATNDNLNHMYIKTIGELANTGSNILKAKLGKLGELLHQYANGLDDSPVLHYGESEDIHTVGNGMTFKRNLTSGEDIQTAVMFLADSVAARMRRHAVKCLGVQVTIKDPDLKVITRQKGLNTPTHLASEIAKEALSLVHANWKKGAPIRMLTITAQKLVPEDEATEQISMFEQTESPLQREKRERLERAIDGIRSKYGSRSVSVGSIVKNDLGINEVYASEDEE